MELQQTKLAVTELTFPYKSICHSRKIVYCSHVTLYKFIYCKLLVSK